MKIYKRIISIRMLIITCFLQFAIFPAKSQDKLMSILKAELHREKASFDTCATPPYFMAYRVEDTRKQVIETSFGTLVESREDQSRLFTPVVRVGSYQLDNFHPGANRRSKTVPSSLPFDENAIAIRQVIWNAVDNSYHDAISAFGKIKASMSVDVTSEDKSPDFSKAKVEKFQDPELKPDLHFDRAKWAERLRRYSALLLKEKKILSGAANMNYEVIRKYYIDTDGSETVENRTAARILISGTVKADDGMDLPLYLSYFAFSPDSLPDDRTIEADVKTLVNKFTEIRKAPIVQPYTGPALLLGSASGVFFHEIFGHRVEGQRMRNESDGQTFKKKVGDLVLPAAFSVYMDPTSRNYHGQDLNGYYKYDDQGVQSERVTVVKDGILKNFLMTRTPLDGFPVSNGHARASGGMDVASRQSNLIVETNDLKTDAQLRTMLLEEAKKQGKEYGYIFASVTGGVTMITTDQPNAFNVTPIEVYRVYVDGRPDEMVRGVDLVGTPLSMFSQIMCAGGKSEIFTGSCGAESGWVPVTAISPSILVKQVEMQRKAKSQERPPILDRPSISFANQK